MDKFVAANLVVAILQLTFIFSVAGDDNAIPLIKPHACYGAAYTYGYHGFNYYDDEFTSYLPQKTYIASYNFSPYIYRLREQFAIGQTLYVRGLIPKNTEEISINLLAKTPKWSFDTGATILNFAISIQGQITLGSIVDGKSELERNNNTSLRYNEEFDVTIRALYDRFEIRINGVKAYDYKHKLPLEIVDTVNVHGKAFITDFRIGGRSFNNVKKVDFPGGHWKLYNRLLITGVPKNETVIITFLHSNGTGNSISYTPIAGKTLQPGVAVTLNFANMANGIVIYLNREYSTTVKHDVNNPEFDYKAVSFSNFDVHDLEVCANMRF